MTIQIYRRIPDGFVYAITYCDDCNKMIEHRPAEPYERVGMTLYVCNWCKDCSPKHDFLLNAPMHVERGVCIGNPNAIAKVKIET